MTPILNSARWLWGLLALALGGLLACRTAPPIPVVDTTQPGWRTQYCPALWRPAGRDAPEIAGELWLTSHADGRALLHFAKVPFPTVTAWRAPGQWQIEYQPQRRSKSGRGAPSPDDLMLWVPEALAGAPVPPPLVVEKLPGPPPAVRLRHRNTGETLTLFSPP
ncbi:MAG: hypothetical protein N3J91_07525 [Verrucomicrobiae bacterium]|nr:hypothetical protein [Verrucomicrobiae bacterium]